MLYNRSSKSKSRERTIKDHSGIADAIFATERTDDYFQMISRDHDVMTYVLYVNKYQRLNNPRITFPLGDTLTLPPLPRPSYVGTMDKTTCEDYLRLKSSDPNRLEYDTVYT